MYIEIGIGHDIETEYMILNISKTIYVTKVLSWHNGNQKPAIEYTYGSSSTHSIVQHFENEIKRDRFFLDNIHKRLL